MTFPTYRHPSLPLQIRIVGEKSLEIRHLENWLPVTKAELRRDYGHVHALWHWLRDRGIKKPNSGPSGKATSEEARKAAGYTKFMWRPHQTTLDALRRIADRWGCERSEVLERLIRAEDEKSQK